MATESIERSLMSFSSKSEGGSAAAVRARWRNAALHDRCSKHDIELLNESFKAAYNNKMTSLEFRNILKTLLGIEYDDEHYKILFMKINSSRTGEIDWDELLSHLILGYFASDTENQRKALELPIMGLPIVIRSQHRQPVSRIRFCPYVAKDRSTDPLQGTYLTASRDGMINWWSLDMKLLRTAYSSNPNLKISTTWVTDMVCMPDVNIIVTSSTERDLRFYDCTAKGFTLKIIITSWEYMICTMYYHFPKDVSDECVLVCGDVGGKVRMLLFKPDNCGLFKKTGHTLISLRHVDLRKKSNLLPELRLVELNHVHGDWVRQVSYYASLHSVVSCATCSDSLLMCDIHGSKTHNVFKVEKGIQCFAFDEEAHVLVTGGPDCLVRVWSPFVTAKANVTFIGHRSGIICIVLQNKGNTIYSLSRDRVIKVWDVQCHVCVQTYIDIPSVVGMRSPISAVYNQGTREFILAAIKIAIVTLDEQLNPFHTDGSTHSRAVSKVLYNPLFKIIITCGMDSIIINWNPLSGQSNLIIRDAHVQQLRGELIPVEITASCFDPGYQLLLTGARNGELKVWNFNAGLCLRVMSIRHMCEVTGCFWVDEKILAVGWDRKVTEFEDTDTTCKGKTWETRHTDDVLAAAVRFPLTMATASYNSELVLWNLDTAHPYRRFSCTDPTQRIKIYYKKRLSTKPTTSTAAKTSQTQKKGFGLRKPSMVAREATISRWEAVQKAKARCASMVSIPVPTKTMRPLAVPAMLFLETRKHHPEVASLIVSLENGLLQCWSDHPAGGYLGSFQAIHMAGDYVSSLATDVNNEFLFTGTTKGYLKVWLMTNYLNNETVHINMPRLRLMFPFLWRDRIEGRAKRCVRDQPMPLLLNSYHAHLRCITTLEYIADHKLVFTGSSDYSVRVWRLSGEYLQTLGSFLPWTLEVTRIPPDVKKVASSTTLKVFNGGIVSRFVPGQKVVEKLSDIAKEELKKVYGAPPDEPLLGHYFAIPPGPERQDRIKLDVSMPRIPLYTHLRMASTQPMRRLSTPALVIQTQLRQAVKAKKASFAPDSPSKQLQLTLRPSATDSRRSRSSCSPP